MIRYHRVFVRHRLSTFHYEWDNLDFPYKKDFSGKDTGIDLVAKTDTGDYWAIQCKCYAEDASIDKSGVDSFLSTSSKQFQNENFEKVSFAHRLWIATTNTWSQEANVVLLNQQPPVSRISLKDLANAPVDWESLYQGKSGLDSRLTTHKLRNHQQDAIDAAKSHLHSHDRGKLIMACGTGKTFTSLRMAEKLTDGSGFVLFLVPSISLLGQTLREWSAQAVDKLQAICVCSDAEVSKASKKSSDDSADHIEDLALPASTNVNSVVGQLRYHDFEKKKSGLTVVFSTYQSIEVISRAQARFNHPFDLIICDEAHRTTGVTFDGDEESAFVRVHDNTFLKATKRIYMTATPRIYGEVAKARAKEVDASLCSMDNADYYGDEFYRIGFGKAVEKLLLSDYKVLILTVHQDSIPAAFQNALASSTNSKEIPADDVMKLAGCINALSKTMIGSVLSGEREIDPEPMSKAVAFCQSIKASKNITAAFNEYKDKIYDQFNAADKKRLVNVTAQHVDGTMSALKRDEKLNWVKSSNPEKRECRILTNVRCLSEGIDVPSLDAVLFLSPRNSQVEVVQSVGRVMRTAPGKKYGYIIIPVIIPTGTSPEDALNESDRFKVVWTVLNALRAHDDRFDAIINQVKLNKRLPTQIQVIDSGTGNSSEGQSWSDEDNNDLADGVDKKSFANLGAFCKVIFAKLVEKVGNKKYWEQWAREVAGIAERHIQQITEFLAKPGPQQAAFETFLKGLHENINPSVSKDDAIQMLAQHLITRPVFDALFENYAFVENNPVSKAMQEMLDQLNSLTLERDRATLSDFYESVKMRTTGIDNGEARQKIVIELYDKFFKTTFPKVVEKLGIVYTPIEVVDFMLQSVADLLKSEFGRDISDENIHILDPFTGTGTFITRLIQSNLITQKAISRKYARELHANEIVLLAYYIASINIENAFHERDTSQPYAPFEGICLTDTFQLGENRDRLDKLGEGFEDNSRRVRAQRKAPLRIIIGNPPYSVGQKSANDNAQNQRYTYLEDRIRQTYVANSDVTNKNSLYDSYIKAFRWSSDRINHPQGGIIAFVSNGAWLDGNAMAGFRKSVEKEFSSIIVFNLRGNQRTSGELSRREGGKIFGSGSRTPIAITFLIKKPTDKTPATIQYYDIGDYLTREEKLSEIKKFASIGAMRDQLTHIKPDEHSDWISHRDGGFEEMIPITPENKFDKKSNSMFVTSTNGCQSNRDAWNYNFSKTQLNVQAESMIKFYNEQICKIPMKEAAEKYVSMEPSKIKWSSSLLDSATRRAEIIYSNDDIRKSLYRPFHKQHLCFNIKTNHRPYQLPKLFPTYSHENLLICVSGVGVTKGFTTIITNLIPDLELIGKSQCFPLYYYEKNEHVRTMNLFDQKDEFIRRDGISDFILNRVRELCGPKATKPDIFYYVYGVLHSETYREKFAVNLKKELPRLPLPEEPKVFWEFSKAGKQLAELHLNYETLAPHPEVLETATRENPSLRINKMRFASRGNGKDKSSIVYNDQIMLYGIPMDAYEYVVNGKPAIEWIMKRYQVSTHKESGIINDPNLWCDEQNDPRYIIDLIKRIVTLSIETMKIVKSLPELKL